jgi:hypothetical protein
VKQSVVLLIFFLYSLFAVAQEEVTFGEEFKLPIRMTRSVGVSGNIGLKSLTGLGVSVQYYVSPRVGIDAGVGVSNYGFNLAGRGRFLITKTQFAPFVSAGFIYGTGSNNQPISISDIDTNEEIWFVLDPSRFVQILVGGDLVSKGGFFLMFGAGVSILTNPGNYEIVSGNPSDSMDSFFNFVYGTGFSTEVSIGYIFGNKKGYRGTF